jgi:hypothetical protein
LGRRPACWLADSSLLHSSSAVAGFRWAVGAAAATLAIFTLGTIWYFVGRGLSEIAAAGFAFLAALTIVRGGIAGRRSRSSLEACRARVLCPVEPAVVCRVSRRLVVAASGFGIVACGVEGHRASGLRVSSHIFARARGWRGAVRAADRWYTGVFTFCTAPVSKQRHRPAIVDTGIDDRVETRRATA